MPFDSGGNFTRVHNWQTDRDNGVRILAQRMDEEFNNFATGMNQVFLRNGIVPMVADLNMNGNAVKNVKPGSALQPGLTFALDPQTGLYQNAAGHVNVGINNSPIADFSSTGLDVVGELRGDTLKVDTTSVLTGAVTMSAAASVGGTLGVTGAVTLASTLGVSGVSTLASAAVTGNATIGGTLGVTGASSFNANLTLAAAAAVDWGGNKYIALNGSGDLTFNGDANDYYKYDRVNNLHAFVIGAAERFRVHSTGVLINGITQFVNDAQFYTDKSGSNPLLVVDVSDFYTYDRANNDHIFSVGNSARLSVNGSRTLIAGEAQFADANFKVLLSGADPVLQWDVGDYYYYNRTSNSHEMRVGNSPVFNVNASNVSLYPATTFFANDSNFYLQKSGSTILQVFDANDYTIYDRTSNALFYRIGGADKFSIQPAVNYSHQNLHIPQTGALIAVGNSGGGGYINMVGSTGTGVTGYIELMRAPGTRVGYIGAAGTAAGAQDINYNNETGGRHNFIGGANFSGVITRDAQYYIEINAGSALINFDSNDLLAFDRAANAFNMLIGGVNKFSLTSTSLTVGGTIADSGGNVRASGNLGGAQWYYDVKLQDGTTWRRTGGQTTVNGDTISTVTLTNGFTTMKYCDVSPQRTGLGDGDNHYAVVVSGTQFQIVNGSGIQLVFNWICEGIL